MNYKHIGSAINPQKLRRRVAYLPYLTWTPSAEIYVYSSMGLFHTILGHLSYDFTRHTTTHYAIYSHHTHYTLFKLSGYPVTFLEIAHFFHFFTTPVNYLSFIYLTLQTKDNLFIHLLFIFRKYCIPFVYTNYSNPSFCFFPSEIFEEKRNYKRLSLQ